MLDQRHICNNCEHYHVFKGVMECFCKDSDYMYTPQLPDNTCSCFEFKVQEQKNKPMDCAGCWYYKTAEICRTCCRNYPDFYAPENTEGE